MKSKYSDTYFAFQYAVKHKDYTKWFSPVILAVDTWSIHVWQTEATRARCYLRREREGVKTQHNWHNSLHVSARLYIAQHWVQCSHSCSLHSSLQHLYFQARLLSTWRTPTLSCATSGPATKSSPCLLPSHPSQPSDWSCQGSLRPRSCSQASFLPILQQTQAHKSRGRSQSCLRVRLCQVWRNRGLQAKLRELTWWCLRLWRIRRVWFWRPA